MKADLLFTCDYGKKQAIARGIDLSTLEMSCGSIMWEGGEASLYSPDHTMGHIEYDGEFYDNCSVEIGGRR